MDERVSVRGVVMSCVPGGMIDIGLQQGAPWSWAGMQWEPSGRREIEGEAVWTLVPSQPVAPEWGVRGGQS